MAEENVSWDEVERALARAGVRHDGGLAKEVRLELWHIAGNAMEGRDAKIDAFIRQQRSNPRFAGEFDPLPSSSNPGGSKDRPYDMLALDIQTFTKIASGEIQVEKVK